MPSPAQGYIDQALTNVSLRYSNTEFIADKVFPVTQVDHETGFYFVYDKANLRVENSTRRGMAHSNEVDYQTTPAPYGPLKEHSLRIGIPQALLDQYQAPLEPRTDATLTVTEKILIEKELGLAATLSNTAIVTQNVALSGTTQFNDYSNSDPFATIQLGFDTLLLNGLVMPNTIVMGWQVWSKLRNHPDLIERVKYAGGGSAIKTLKPDDMSSLFDIPNVIISKAVQNVSAEGQAASMQFLWGKNIQLLSVDSGSDIRNVTAGRTLTLKNARGIYNWLDEEPGVGEWIKYKDQWEQRIVAQEAIYAILNAVA